MSPYPRLPVRHAVGCDEGISFIDYLNRLSDERGVLRQRQLAFINEWDYLVDDLERRPMPADYAERWDIPRSTVYSLLAEFRRPAPSKPRARSSKRSACGSADIRASCLQRGLDAHLRTGLCPSQRRAQ